MAELYRRLDFRLLFASRVALYFVVALLLSMPLLAQSHFSSGPPAAGSGPAYDVSAGYSYLSTSIPGAGRVDLYGLNAGGHVDFAQRWGVALDSGYVRTASIPGTGKGGFILTVLGGPVFYPTETRNSRVFLHALVGVGLVDSAVPLGGNKYLQGWVGRYAYALGGGFERSITNRFAVRLGGDYLRTAFANSSAQVQLQNNLRVTASFVVRLRERGWYGPF